MQGIWLRSGSIAFFSKGGRRFIIQEQIFIILFFAGRNFQFKASP